MTTAKPPALPKEQPPPLPRQHPPPLPRTKVGGLIRVFGVPVPEELSRRCGTGKELTNTGKLLVGFTGLATLAFAFGMIFWVLPAILPQGTGIPGLVIGIAIIAFGAMLFICGSWITEKLGFPATEASKESHCAEPSPPKL